MSRRPRPSPEPTDDPLALYRSKRNFGITPEPEAGGRPTAKALTFVVQKHWASSLHYDLRLELDGTMKSWAVPKGPSFDTAVKRMAVQVEDHPLSYADFEGTIPAGQYGAGKVIVWDAGTWLPLTDPQQGLREGNLKFELQGHKLRGRWVLVRMKGSAGEQTAWLLIKKKDSYARAAAVAGLPAEAVPCALPQVLSPQLASSGAGPPADAANWLCEIKFDGYRMLVRNDGKGARLLTRNGHDWTSKLPALQAAFERQKLPPGWYDGEIIVANEAGMPDFGALQQAFDSQRTDDVVLYLFDLPYARGHDLRRAPLDARRAVLKDLLAKGPVDRIRFSEAFDASPESVVASACKLGLEGVIAKRRDSSYRSARSADWIKLKCSQRQEFVIGGFTAARGSRAAFGALLLGVHDAHGELQNAGNVGTGFSQKALQDIQRRLDRRIRATSPFAADSKFAGQPQWVEPTLVAEVSFGEWTRAGRVRHAVFRGLRDDKAACTIVREMAQRVTATQKPNTALAGRAAAASTASPLRLQVTNPQRVIDARTGTTKVELLRFYGLVGELMMKHLVDRPVSLVRAPAGVDGELFFQKHAQTERLPGIRQLDAALAVDHAPLIEVASKRGLLSAAQWNVVEFHTQNAAAVSYERPDRMVFDLDPGEGVPWAQVQQAAQLMHAFLAQLGLPAFLKTSGGKGLHVVVPVKRMHDWDTVKGFSRAVVGHMAKTIPQRFVARSGPKNRVGRIYIDCLRNGRGATTVCAWSARARPGLGVSVPVAWDELPSLRAGDHWSLKTVHQRLDVGNQPWRGYARSARGLAAAMSALGFAPPAA